MLDKSTGELVERITYQPYGATESDHRPARWSFFREDYRFTGKEEDAEVGLTYFGQRYLSPYLGRWLSADPLELHNPGSTDPNLYAYVRGRTLQAVDPLGLQDKEAQAQPSVVIVNEAPEALKQAAGGSLPPGSRWVYGGKGTGQHFTQSASEFESRAQGATVIFEYQPDHPSPLDVEIGKNLPVGEPFVRGKGKNPTEDLEIAIAFFAQETPDAIQKGGDPEGALGGFCDTCLPSKALKHLIMGSLLLGAVSGAAKGDEIARKLYAKALQKYGPKVARFVKRFQVGTYINKHIMPDGSVKRYVGKGTRGRSRRSARRMTREHGGEHVSTEFIPASGKNRATRNRNAFKEESRQIDKYGGEPKDNPNLLNENESPGRRYRREDGENIP